MGWLVSIKTVQVLLVILSLVFVKIESKPAFERHRRNVDEGGCSSVIESDQGEVTSPRYPMTYPSRSDCNTTIVVGEGMAVRITFSDFHLEKHTRCKYDYIRLTDLETGKSSGPLCGVKQGMSWTSDSNRLEIIFRSDSSVNKKGYNATFQVVDPSSVESSNDTTSTVTGEEDSDCSCGLYLYNSCFCSLATTNPKLTRFAIDSYYNTMTSIINNIGRRRRRDVGDSPSSSPLTTDSAAITDKPATEVASTTAPPSDKTNKCPCGLYVSRTCLCELAKTNPALARLVIDNYYKMLRTINGHIIGNIGRQRRHANTVTYQ